MVSGYDKWYLKLVGAGIVCAPCLIGMALSKTFMQRHSYHIISFAVACMMATVFLEMLPELMHEAPGKIGTIRLHWVDGQEYAQLSKNTATFICAILLAGLVFGGLMEAFLHMLSPHGHAHGHGGGHGHGHGHGHEHGHEKACEMAHVDEEKQSEHSHHSGHSHGSQCSHGHGHGHGPGAVCPHGHTTEGKPDAPPPKAAKVERISVDLAKLEEGNAVAAIRSKSTTFGLPTLIVLDLMARSIHHTIDGIVAGVQNASGRSFWSVIMALTCHEIGHSLGGIGLYMNLGVGKKKAVTLITVTQVITTFLGTLLGMVLTEYSTDAMLDIYMQPVAIGIMLYIGLVDLLPELGHMKVTGRQKMINCAVVIVAILSVAGVGLLMPHSHGAGTGPKNYYVTRKEHVTEVSKALAAAAPHHHGHFHGGGECCGGHDHHHAEEEHVHSACCGHGHAADMEFQAEQTMRLASVTLNVIKAQKEEEKNAERGLKPKDLDKLVQEYVEDHLKGKNVEKHPLHALFNDHFAAFDANAKVDKDPREARRSGHRHHSEHGRDFPPGHQHRDREVIVDVPGASASEIDANSGDQSHQTGWDCGGCCRQPRAQ